MKYVLILATLVTLALSLCSKNIECAPSHYCNIKSVCEPRPLKYCQNNNHCSLCETCQKLNPRLGKCVTMKNVDCPLEAPKSELILVPEMTKSEFESTPIKSPVRGFCGTQDFDIERQNLTKGVPACGSNECDDPAVRETYNSLPNKTLKLYWMVFNCTPSWYLNPIPTLQASTTELNNKYASIGITFQSWLSYHPCKGRDGTQDYTTFSENKVVTAVLKEKGSGWRNSGGFVLVTGTPQQQGLLGFMYFPGGSYSGIGFLNWQALGRGQKTLPHEMGHGFGLLHTFNGISETQGCSTCYENEASDIKGDFCLDTPPIPRNWECTSPLRAAGSYADRCTQRTQWNNPFTNMMSYGSCPNQAFTSCQVKRVRCGFTKRLTWLRPVQ